MTDPANPMPPARSGQERGEVQLLVILCLCVFASSVAWRALDPMLPVMASDLHVTLDQAVLLASAYSLPFALMQLVFGPLGDAWGKMRLLRISVGMVAVSLLLMALAPNYTTVMVARVLSGGFGGGVNPVAIALLSERIAFEHRQVALARIMVVMIGGQMLGATFAGLLVDAIGWRAVVALTGLLVAAVCVLCVLRLDSRDEPRSRPRLEKVLASYRAIFARPIAFFVMGTLICEGIVVLGLIPFVAGMLLERHGAGAAQAGIVIGCFAVGGMSFGLLVRRFLAALGPWNMVRAGGTLVGAALASTAVSVHWTMTAACFFLAGFGFYMMHNSIMVRVTELNPDARGASVSVGAFSFTSGQGIAPLAWTTVAVVASYSQIFVLAGLLTVILGFGVARQFSKRLAAG